MVYPFTLQMDFDRKYVPYSKQYTFKYFHLKQITKINIISQKIKLYKLLKKKQADMIKYTFLQKL